jgi:hypothetical protein
MTDDAAKTRPKSATSRRASAIMSLTARMMSNEWARASVGSPLVEPFDVIAVYSFEGDKCARVEFIR